MDIPFSLVLKLDGMIIPYLPFAVITYFHNREASIMAAEQRENVIMRARSKWLP
jgi:hypothetical protein